MPANTPSISPRPAELVALSKRFLMHNALFFVLIAMCMLLALLTPNFLTANNLLNNLRQGSYIGLIAIGMTFVILSAGIDLSVGSLVASSAIIFAALGPRMGMATPVAILVALLSGAVIGFGAGLIVAFLKVPPFVTTLGMMSVVRGLVLVFTGGEPTSGFGPFMVFLGEGYLLGVPAPVYIFAIAAIAAAIVLRRARFGRYVYGVGGSEEAARLSGINVERIQMSVYVISGVLSSASGLLLAARLDSAQPMVGVGFELEAVAAVCIGGTSLFGGKGGVGGSIIGVLIMVVLRNGLNLLGVSTWWQQVAIGAILILAVYISTERKAT
jgi:ribose transport system permease protein